MFKYRAKRLDGDGGWIQGKSIQYFDDGTIYLEKDCSKSKLPNFMCPIDPSTLGVSWGIKDKDVDVFTGDMLEDCCGYKGVVVFSIERSEFCLQVGDSLHPIIQGDYYKLIGNIHDNPEIIEEE